MRHHNYYNRGWTGSRRGGRGVTGFSPRRLSPSLGSDDLHESKVPTRREIRAQLCPSRGITDRILLCLFADPVLARLPSASKHCQPPRNGRISMTVLMWAALLKNARYAASRPMAERNAVTNGFVSKVRADRAAPPPAVAIV